MIGIFKPLIAIALLTATPSHAAKYIGKVSVDMTISVRIVANCSKQADRWCKERGKCCEKVKK